jgi:hypothetical protein
VSFSDEIEALLGACNDAFGEPVTYIPATGSPFAITGIFDQAYREVSLIEDAVPITTEQPVLGVRLSEFAAAPLQGDKLSIASVNATYIVREVRLDGHGHAKLMLNFVSAP